MSGICAQLHSEPASPFSRSPSFLQPALLRVGSPCPGRAHCHREPQHQPVSHPRTPALHPTKDLGLLETDPGSRIGEWCLPPSLFGESLLAESFPSYPFGFPFPKLSLVSRLQCFLILSFLVLCHQPSCLFSPSFHSHSPPPLRVPPSLFPTLIIPSPGRYTYEIAPVFVLMEEEVLKKLRALVGWSSGDGVFCPGM